MRKNTDLSRSENCSSHEALDHRNLLALNRSLIARKTTEAEIAPGLRMLRPFTTG
jgi:hypothetical protein